MLQYPIRNILICIFYKSFIFIFKLYYKIKIQKKATLNVFTQVILYNYGSLNKEQESLKQQLNKNIFPGKINISTFKIPEKK